MNCCNGNCNQGRDCPNRKPAVIDVPFKEVKRSLWARIPPIVKGAILAAVYWAITNGVFK